MLLLALLQAAPLARAACVVSQTGAPDGVEFDVASDGTCPVVTVTADRPARLRAWQEDDGFRHRLRADQVQAHPWATPALGWRLLAPTLGPGDRLVIELLWQGEASGAPHVDVDLDGRAPRLARGGIATSTWAFEADKHPQWGFTDPRQGRMEKRTHWTFGPEGEPGWLDGPRVDSGDGAWWPGGEGSAETLRVEAPASAFGSTELPPGRLHIGWGTAALDVATSGDVDATATDAGLDVQAPAGGELRWRVRSAGGVGVIPDEVGFVAGLDTHFRLASLHEPSLPMSLRGDKDMNRVLQALWEAVRAPIRVPGDFARPRPLNRAWRSGWLTDGERALVLLRLLGQEHVAARWVLTGAHPDPTTFVGFDHLLVAAQLPNSDQVVWLDPACTTCALGEVDPALSGRPALGGAERAPLLRGSLDVDVAFVQAPDGTLRVRTQVHATGAGARWLRQSIPTPPPMSDKVGPPPVDGAGAAPAPVEALTPSALERVASLFGASAATVSTSGWTTDDVQITIESATPPRPVDLPRFGG